MFIDERFPTSYSYHVQGGPKYAVMIQQAENGVEVRIPSWGGTEIDSSLSEFDLHSRDITGDWKGSVRGDYDAFLAFWKCVAQGQVSGFRFNNELDNYSFRSRLRNTVTGGLVGDGVTTTFQLTKEYTSPAGTTVSVKDIYKPLGTQDRKSVV